MNCYLCGSEKLEALVDKTTMRFNCFNSDKVIYRCLDCNLVQLLPQWTEEELTELYKKYSLYQDFKGSKRKIKISKSLLKHSKMNDLCFEIGAGEGHNVDFLNKHDRVVFGVDKEPSISHPRIVNCDLFDYDSESKFDFIYAIHAIEHFPDPLKMINWIVNHLSSSGKFLLEFPNIEDPLLSVYHVEEFAKFYWYPFHLFFFTPKTITSLIEKYNESNTTKVKIEVHRIQEYGLVNHLRWILFKKPGNFNKKIPLLDNLYCFFLTKILKKSDTLLIVGKQIV